MILVFNVAIFVSYYLDATSASTIVIFYYMQSVFIGIQYFVRLLNLARIGRDPETGKGQYGVAFFFLFHYGMFHAVYFVFLLGMMADIPGRVDFDIVRWVIVALIGNTILSTISDIKRDREEPKVAGVVMFQPYLRVVPMHLLIIFGFNSENSIEWAFMLFVGLKTIADMIMHIVVNKTYLKKRPNVTEGWI